MSPACFLRCWFPNGRPANNPDDSCEDGRGSDALAAIDSAVNGSDHQPCAFPPTAEVASAAALDTPQHLKIKTAKYDFDGDTASLDVPKDSAHSVISSIGASPTKQLALATSHVLRLLSDAKLSSAKQYTSLDQLDTDLRDLVLVGRGGHGNVFLAEWRDAPVAVKICTSSSSEQLQSNLLETMANRVLAHPNIIHTYAAVVLPVEDSWLGSTAPSQPQPCTFLIDQLDHSQPARSPGLAGDQTRDFVSRVFLEAHSQQWDHGQECDGPPSRAWESSSQPDMAAAVDVTSSSYQQLGDAKGTAQLEATPNLPLHRWNTRLQHLIIPSAATSSSSRSEHHNLPMMASPRGPVPGPPTPASPAGCATPTSGLLRGRLSDDFPFAESFSRRPGCTFRQALESLGVVPGHHVCAIIMEHCDRGSLQQATRRGLFQASQRWGKWTALRALVRTAREASQGMQHLHSNGIIHGDLKPGNVLLKSSRLDRRGFAARVSDFGLSTLAALQCRQDQPSVGTLTYAAPETVDGRVLPASDVWSFGVMLWEMATAEQAFADLHWAQLMTGLVCQDITLEWPSKVHPVVRQLGAACCHYDPAARPTFEEITLVLRRLEHAISQECSRASPAATPWSLAASPCMSLGKFGCPAVEASNTSSQQA